jgi:hypothetical protein
MTHSRRSDFKTRVQEVMAVMEPLVSVLNELLVPTPRHDEDEAGSGEEEEVESE